MANISDLEMKLKTAKDENSHVKLLLASHNEEKISADKWIHEVESELRKSQHEDTMSLKQQLEKLIVSSENMSRSCR